MIFVIVLYNVQQDVQCVSPMTAVKVNTLTRQRGSACPLGLRV